MGNDRKILVIDVGGTHVKVLATGERLPRRFKSGPGLTARGMVAAVKPLVADWRYDVVSIGVPTPVVDGRIVAEPVNLGGGWKTFDFAAALGRPVRPINDAAMQALGSYLRGRMLFLGIGTGLGSALVTDQAWCPSSSDTSRTARVAVSRTTWASAGSSGSGRRGGALTS